jgi:hypothetical protein
MASQPTIFLLSGWSQSGKDTAADFMCKRYALKKFAFADAPKVAVAEKYDFPFGWTQTQDGKQLTIQTDTGMRTVRELIIEYANSERTKNPFAWAEVVAKQIRKNIVAGQTKFVISDWRFIDELVGLQKELYDYKPIIYTVQIIRNSQIISPVPDKTEYELLGFPFYIRLENPGDHFFFTNIGRILYPFLTE